MDIAGLVLGYIAVIGGMTIAPLAIWRGARIAHRKRELEHMERMRAMELGLTLPQDEPRLSPSKIGAMIAVAVPLGAFISAATATSEAGYHEVIWLAAAMAGTAGVICGSVLVTTAIRKPAHSSAPAIEKPYIEEDAYDVVSSRG
jgi:hypothetical protein